MHLYILDLNDTEQCSAWDRFLETYGPAGLNCMSPYLKSMVHAFGHSNQSVIAYSDTLEVVGCLPLVLTESLIFGTHLTSLPFFNYGGLFSESEAVKKAMLDFSIGNGKKCGAKAIQLRESCPNPWLEDYSNTQPLTHKVHMRLALSGVKDQFGMGNAKQRSKLKSQAKLAERRANETGISLRTVIGRHELLDDFYEVFSRHMRDLGTPVYAKSWFCSLLTHLGESARLAVTYFNEEPGSVSFLIQHHDYMNVPWASSLKKFNYLSLNTYHYWNTLNAAQELKVSTFDFGRSTDGEGTYRFKEQWGAQPSPCYWYNIPLTPSGQVDNLSPSNPQFSLAIAIWKRLPLFFTNFIGPHIVKSIP